VLWSTKGAFGVNDPVLPEQTAQERTKGSGIGPLLQIAEKTQLVPTEKAIQSGNKLASEYATEYFDGQQKGSARVYPVCVIGGQTTGGNNAMDVRMKPSSRTIP
jgi:hypothetical protein